MLKFNPDLIEDLARRRVVLFLGAGVSASAATISGDRIKQWECFLRSLLEKVPDRTLRELATNFIAQKDFLMACQIMRELLEDDSHWEEELRKEFAKVGVSSDLHKAIVSLDQRIIVTTNFDKILETVWHDCKPTATHYPTIIQSLDDDVFKIFRNELYYIIKLHGSIDEPKSMIFSKSDYNKNAYGNWAYTKFIEILLVTHTFLFIGFSMNDPAISHLVEMHAQLLPKSRPHYIFLPGEMPEKYIDIMKRLRRLFVLPYSTDNNHAALIELIKELADKAQARRRAILGEELRLLTK
jgi:NAD-dependent SIR2 family protein deacetylase